MALEKYLSTQTAIVLAGALIAAGLFFGLRGRDSASPSAPVSTTPTSIGPLVTAPPSATQEIAPKAAAPPDLPPQPQGQLTPAAQAAAQVAAQKALDAHRAEIIDKCLKPSVAKNPDPPQVKYTFDLVFGPDGKQIARGLIEHREALRGDVGVCINTTLPSLQIPPPGANARTSPEWTLP